MTEKPVRRCDVLGALATRLPLEARGTQTHCAFLYYKAGAVGLEPTIS